MLLPFHTTNKQQHPNSNAMPRPVAGNGAVRRRAAANNGVQLQQQQPDLKTTPWFLGAPITKLLCMFWAAGSLWVIHSSNNNTDTHHGSAYSEPSVWYGPSSWFFQSTSELLIALSFLAQYLRRMEQELSSRRLVAWLVVLEAVYLFVRLVVAATMDEEIAGGFADSSAANGPYLVVGGVLYWYKVCVPRLYPGFLSSTTLGLSCSEKSFPYLWASYVLFLRGTASLLVGAIGVLASAIYFFLLFLSNNGSNVRIPFLDVPDAIVNMVPWESLGGTFLLDSSPKVYAPFLNRAALNPRRHRGGRGGQQQQQQQQQVRVEEPVAVAVPAPPPEAIAQLTSMGFEEQRVKEALQVSDNNVERAANLLLAGS